MRGTRVIRLVTITYPHLPAVDCMLAVQDHIGSRVQAQVIHDTSGGCCSLNAKSEVCECTLKKIAQSFLGDISIAIVDALKHLASLRCNGRNEALR